MIKRRCLALLLALPALTILAGVGCSSSQSSTRTRWSYALCQGHLNEYLDFELSHDMVSDRIGVSPTHKYEQLMLRVTPRDDLRERRALKTIDLVPGASRKQLRFENVQARTDDTRTRIWFVETETGRILATLDRETGVATGPDDTPPSWAISDGGVLIETTSD